MVPVREIQRQGAATLVEWQSKQGLQRATVPTAAIQDGQVAAEELARGIPYGLPWEEIAQPQVTGAAIAAQLRQHGLWTLQDIQQRPQAVVGALQAAYGLDAATLQRRARQFEEER